MESSRAGRSMRSMRVLLCWCGALCLAAVEYGIALGEGAFDCSLVPDPIEAASVVVQMPATAPGTYQVHDWGRFVEDMRAFDAAGTALPVEATGTNTWRVDQAPRLARLEWRVVPSFDADHGELPIYPMAGTALAEDHIVVNHFGVCAYLRGQEGRPLTVRYRDLPADWEAACALEPRRDGGDLVVSAEDYHQLADSPLLAGQLQVTRWSVDGTELVAAAWNAHGAYGAFDAETMRRHFGPVVTATRDWLDGLPVDRYAFLVHSRAELGGMAGALEHRRSSLYVLPPTMPGIMLRQIAAHEFFHIVTPLNIRTPLVDGFDFGDPVAPRHLWFYEGVTEYASHLVLRRAGMIGDAGLLGTMQRKLEQSRAFDQAVSLVALSEGCLGEHRELYMDVYLRGATTAMAFDLELRRLSGNRAGLRELLVALIAAYGPDRPIPADGFFAAIGAHSDPAIVPWLEAHVAGTATPAWDRLLAPAGVMAWQAGGRWFWRLRPDPTPGHLAWRARWLEGGWE